MRIAMVEAGYVGLVSGACLADFGHGVVCIDRESEKVASLNAGRMPIYKPGLDAPVAENVRQDRLAFHTALPEAVAEADAVFIAVCTPSHRGDGFADLSFVFGGAGADALIIVTEWNAFRALDLARLHATIAAPVLVDLRNIYRAEELERYGSHITMLALPEQQKAFSKGASVEICAN